MTTMNKTTLTAVALSLAVLGGCDTGARLETRTFRLNHMRSYEAQTLIDPYVYGDREGHPGAVSVIEGAITVRETRDNLEQIERVLSDFDQPRADIRLYFQLIEADGFTDSDPRIAAVEEELRSLFQFRGYRLAGEATLTATDMTEIGQLLGASDGLYRISGSVYRLGPDVTRLEGISLSGRDGTRLETTVNIRSGQTIVLGSSPTGGSTATLLLTVRAERVADPA
jgi:hypothetical protein